MALHFGGKLSITTAMDIAFMFPVEVLPTVARSQAVSFIHTLGFVISFASPYIVLLVRKHFFYNQVQFKIYVHSKFKCIF